jgi:hypothetical protein
MSDTYEYSSRIHPKGGVVYYNLVIIEGEPLGEFYATEEEAIGAAGGILAHLGGDPEGMVLESIHDAILEDDRVAYCDIARELVAYE